MKNNESKAFQSKSLNSETVNDSCQLETVGQTIAECVKHSSAPYVAVVNGKQPRRDPMIEYTKRMSPIDVADFWEAYGKLSDDEQTAYRRSFASAAGRG